jgi:hypothetical protein
VLLHWATCIRSRKKLWVVLGDEMGFADKRRGVVGEGVVTPVRFTCT